MTGDDLDRLKPIAGVDVRNKRVLVRADLNVPLAEGRVSDRTRLERIAPGLADLSRRGAKVIVISHLGRPKKGSDAALSLKPVADALGDIVGKPIAFARDCIGPEAEAAIAALKAGDIAVLENLRFHSGEELNDPQFARALAKLGDIYVGDAFSTAHRAHASTDAITLYLPSYAGPLMMEEIEALRRALDRPERPVAALIGGAKVSSKIAVLTNLIARVDRLLIGGAMANTFFLAQGVDIGKSLAEPDLTKTALGIMTAAKDRGCEIVLPHDVVVAEKLAAGTPASTHRVLEIPPRSMVLDVGPETVAHFVEIIGRCRTLLWNGPLGAFETPPFGEGTFALARQVAAMTKAGRLVSVAGGGDTVAALNAAGVSEALSYVSTAGGAFLEWLEGRTLPGVAALARSTEQASAGAEHMSRSSE
jgi:phosphoglycerate kinase